MDHFTCSSIHGLALDLQPPLRSAEYDYYFDCKQSQYYFISFLSFGKFTDVFSVYKYKTG